ncbi:MAG: hypothetical protein GY820_34620 [Gammaproteobacteria bacterium]|nr:hypothetical protein [Gammaproteobacteria bacterium]
MSRDSNFTWIGHELRAIATESILSSTQPANAYVDISLNTHSRARTRARTHACDKR